MEAYDGKKIVKRMREVGEGGKWELKKLMN